MEKDHLTIREFENHSKYMKDSIEEIKQNVNRVVDKLDSFPDKFISRQEFEPFKSTLSNVVNTLVGTIITAFLSLIGYIAHLILK